MVKISEDKIIIARKVADFYWRKNNLDDAKTNAEIENLKIQDFTLTDQDVVIHTCRPGLLIGRYGENIKNLENFLGIKVRILEVDNVNNYMFIYDPMDFLD